MARPNTCEAETRRGLYCKNPRFKNTNYCYVHRDYAQKNGQRIDANFLDRLIGLFQTRKIALIGAIVGFIVGMVGFINAFTGDSFIEFVRKRVPCTWPSICVNEADTFNIAYMILEAQLEAFAECPEGLRKEEWGIFQRKLSSLNFNRLTSPYDTDFGKYRDKFVEFITEPPKTAFDCGVMWGELLIAARPMLTDLEITEAKARSDGQGVPLAKGIGEMITGELGLKNQYLLYLGFRPDRFESLGPEARAFVEYLSIWMVMYFEDERNSAVERAQGALLGMSPNMIGSYSNYEEYQEIHDDLFLLSRSHVQGDQTGIVRHGSRAVYILSDLSLSVISDQELLYVGGDRLLQIVHKMHDVARGGVSDLHELEQMIEVFRSIINDIE